MNLSQVAQILSCLLLFGVLAQAKTLRYKSTALDSEAQESRIGSSHPYIALDQDTAATGHHHGRVQIKVYRGPDQHGHDHEHFAPHGYWVKQPADDDHHH